VGELLLPFPSQITWDRSALESRGLAVTPWIQGSARHWTYLWRGGDLATAVLGGESPPGEPSDPSLEIFEDPATYAALFEGPFPSAARTGDDTRGNPGSDGLELLPESPGEDGRLLLIGNSKLFENDLLTRKGYDHELFALRAAAALCLDAELASFLDRAPGAPSIDLQSDRARLLWRLFVLGGFPLLLLIVGAWRRVRP
jgi:hypothetical protein